ncbi:hypothetical protein HGRIS_009809 [Hohenbuehelia grisea]|uniref:Vacuolar-sorting protein SNF7 n=1 Tax=Hohenbuehelia grisea TaxID=104357 RepID=A0ABR3J2T1_9AGAR
MMAGFMNYFAGRRDPKQSARDAIVTLRQQLQMIEKKEDYLQKKIETELKTAKANAVTNKAVATAALRRKKASEQDLDRLQGTRLQLELQVNTLENANLNAETMSAMKKASDALKVIHGNLTMDKVDATMSTVAEQRELANEVAEAISNPMYGGMELDDADLKAELEELEQDQLNERLMGAEHVPVHQPGGVNRIEERQSFPSACWLFHPIHYFCISIAKTRTAVEDDEDAQLRELQASLAM